MTDQLQEIHYGYVATFPLSIILILNDAVCCFTLLIGLLPCGKELACTSKAYVMLVRFKFVNELKS